MIPRSIVDDARDALGVAKEIAAEGGSLDVLLGDALARAAAAATEEDRELWRGKAADQLMQAHSAVKVTAQDAADAVWSESIGKPAPHGGYLGREFYLGKLFGSDAVASRGSSPKKLVASARSWLYGECDRAYDWAMEDNQAALGDPEVRYAHVPAGPKPCELCCAIGSRGFSYKRPPRANHRGCKCVVVAGREGTSVEGYDPDLLYKAWRNFSAQDGYDSDKSYRRLQEYVAKARDIPYVDAIDGAKPDDKEKVVAFLIARKDREVLFIDKGGKSDSSTPDTIINDDYWEFKVPEKWNDKTVKNQFKKSLKKRTSNLLISGTYNGVSLEDMEKKVLELFADGEYPQITNVWLVDRRGNEMFLKRDGNQSL